MAGDLTAIGGLIAVIVAATIFGGFAAYRALYSPAAFVTNYLDLLASRHAVEALAVPGVAIDRSQLSAAGLPQDASDALLRQAALASLTDIHVVSQKQAGDHTEVTVAYRAGGYPGRTTFDVVRNGWIGIVPGWRFATSPLAVVDLTVHGSADFQVNGFPIDKRQVSTAGVRADLAAPVHLLVFSPGLYAVRVDTSAMSSPTKALLSDAPFRRTAVEVQARPTPEFLSVVQQRVDEFLTACARQHVLQPTGCPFGTQIDDRVAEPPDWSIVKQPVVTLIPDGENWAIRWAHATAHVTVPVQSLFDGSMSTVDADVPFGVTGSVSVDADGRATIEITATPND
ncbi:hypothetical protein LK09_17495 [Microbacterium mangrovi]|uniref:Uncharacterized protein n=1 Tax=Microbacterium mangrovi TaxID=1348253 RepID=A0A0B2A2W7_9MICO|nr:hypothetical protein LK09_17495 [Microbacterium mangrovi]